MSITFEEVLKFGTRWLKTVMTRGSLATQAAFFADPDSRLYMAESGELMRVQANYDLHCQLTNESCTFSDFTLTVLNRSLERVRATGRFYLAGGVCEEAVPNVIKSIVGEDWIIQRMPLGELKFVLYMVSYHQLLPDSAALQLE